MLDRDTYQEEQRKVINRLRELSAKPEYCHGNDVYYEVMFVHCKGYISTYEGCGDLADDEVPFKAGTIQKVIEEIGKEELMKLLPYSQYEKMFQECEPQHQSL